MRKWNKVNCLKESLKYKRKIDFLKSNKLAYNASYKHGWLDEICSHMKISGDKYNRCVYAYEFSDNCVYIGLTHNLEKRDKQHRSNTRSNNSCVLEHINKTKLKPNLIKLSDYIYYENAAKSEGEFLDKYKNNGWIILNKNKTGSLGSSNLIYTKYKCKEIIDDCVYLSDLYKSHGRVMFLCKKNNWFIDEINNLIRQKMSNNHWTKERCREESICYSDMKNFIKKSGSAYRSALKNGWLEEITSHMCLIKRSKGYWTKERCREESKKYKKRCLFQVGSIGAYKASYRNKWLDEFFN